MSGDRTPLPPPRMSTPLGRFDDLEADARRNREELRNHRFDVEVRFEDAKAELARIDSAIKSLDVFLDSMEPTT